MIFCCLVNQRSFTKELNSFIKTTSCSLNHWTEWFQNAAAIQTSETSITGDPGTRTHEGLLQDSQLPGVSLFWFNLRNGQ